MKWKDTVDDFYKVEFNASNSSQFKLALAYLSLSCCRISIMNTWCWYKDLKTYKHNPDKPLQQQHILHSYTKYNDITIDILREMT
jgi:hypothetical protein